MHLDSNNFRHHDAPMRTTVTIDPDVERLIHDAMHRHRQSFKMVMNDAIRAGLGRQARASGSRSFRVTPFSLGLRPGIDPARLNQLADELEDEAIQAKIERREAS